MLMLMLMLTPCESEEGKKSLTQEPTRKPNDPVPP